MFVLVVVVWLDCANPGTDASSAATAAPNAILRHHSNVLIPDPTSPKSYKIYPASTTRKAAKEYANGSVLRMILEEAFQFQ